MKPQDLKLSKDSTVSALDRDLVIRDAYRAHVWNPGVLGYFNGLFNRYGHHLEHGGGIGRIINPDSRSTPRSSSIDYTVYPRRTKYIAVFLAAWPLLFSFGAIPIWIIEYVIVYYASNRRRKKHRRSYSNHCRSCDYSLDGLDSLGTVLYNQYELPVGPLHCPECGKKYPLISG